MKTTHKKFVQWLVLILCGVFIGHSFFKNRDAVRLLLRIPFLLVLLMVGMNFLYFLFHGWRYKIVLEKCSNRSIGFWSWFKIMIIGRFLGSIIPQLGNVYRCVVLKKEHQVTYTRYVSSFFSFTWMDTGLNLLLAWVVIGLLNPILKIGPFFALYMVPVFILLIVVGPLLFELFSRSVTVRVRYLSWAHEKISEVFRVSVQNLQDWQYMIRFFLLGLMTFSIANAIFFLTFYSMGLRVETSQVVLLYVLLKLSSLINLTPGNLGIQEIAFGFLSEQMDIGMAEGMLVSMVVRVVTYIFLVSAAVPMGGLEVLRKKEEYGKNSEALDS